MTGRPMTLGVIVGNRDFFPDPLVTEARRDIQELFDRLGLRPVWVPPSETKLGGIETRADALKCAELFRRHLDLIDGVLVTLPNFGDEKGVAEALKGSGLKVPILVQAYPDDLDRLDASRRRDAFCGKISVCNNLHQAGLPFSLTARHVVRPGDPSFEDDLRQFLSVCRVVKGLRGARLGAVGARPGAFNTVRYSEKVLERQGIGVTTLDLSEVLSEARRLDAADGRLKNRLESLRSLAPAGGLPEGKLLQMARLGAALDGFADEHGLDALAVQCWSSLQRNYGCNACAVMSLMSEGGRPCACEVDVMGALTLLALQLASGSPAALADWNNNYGRDDDACVLFHCGNWARPFLPDARIGTAPILGSVLGEENTWGALSGRVPAGPLTFGRLTTDDNRGLIRAYVGEGRFTDDAIDTFGARGVARVPRLQSLLRHVCSAGFEHHVAMTASSTAGALAEAFGKYLGWETYRHGGPGP